jgi:antitoxin SocA-like protein
LVGKGPVAAQFDSERFEALVLFIADRRKDDPRFGRTKLAKALFYSDFDVYRDRRKSLTGATYIRMPFGPFPEQLEAAEKTLSDRDVVYLDYVTAVYEEKRIVPLKPLPDLSGLFEPWALHLVGTWTDRVASASAREISRLSHHHPGWLLARETGEPIPYETALLPQERPTGQDADRAKEIARERGWLSDQGWVWERDTTPG